jgi:hypothetical protein
MGDFERWGEGPVPAAGGSISNLWAEADPVTGKFGEATVEVLDMKPPTGALTPVMTCKLTTSTTITTCSNTGSPVPISPGHFILVRVTFSPTSAMQTSWRVTFRY